MVENVSSVFDTEGRPRVKTLLELDVQEVAFRECGKRWTFCDEMKVRGRLRDLERDRTLYDGILLHSNRSGRSSFSSRMDRTAARSLADQLVEEGIAESHTIPEGGW